MYLFLCVWNPPVSVGLTCSFREGNHQWPLDSCAAFVCRIHRWLLRPYLCGESISDHCNPVPLCARNLTMIWTAAPLCVGNPPVTVGLLCDFCMGNQPVIIGLLSRFCAGNQPVTVGLLCRFCVGNPPVTVGPMCRFVWGIHRCPLHSRAVFVRKPISDCWSPVLLLFAEFTGDSCTFVRESISDHWNPAPLLCRESNDDFDSCTALCGESTGDH